MERWHSCQRLCSTSVHCSRNIEFFCFNLISSTGIDMFPLLAGGTCWAACFFLGILAAVAQSSLISIFQFLLLKSHFKNQSLQLWEIIKQSIKQMSVRYSCYLFTPFSHYRQNWVKVISFFIMPQRQGSPHCQARLPLDRVKSNRSYIPSTKILISLEHSWSRFDKRL